MLRCGTRAALVFERELPVGDCAAARHASELAAALLAHAEREYFPAAASELEGLVRAARGYAFKPHRLQLTVCLDPAGAGLCMRTSLCYTVGGEVRLAQSTHSFWTADGAYRLRRVPKRVEKSDK